VPRVIPTDPFWFPPPGAEAPLHRYASIAFMGPAEPFTAIGCPACGAPLDEAWWRERMDAGYDRARDAYEVLTVTTPCCERLVSLNDLAYDPPAGFARVELAADDLARAAAALGHPVRAVS
jgi:DNA-directed RNA polymerase subunit N (RpoN/RPB10)